MIFPEALEERVLWIGKRPGRKVVRNKQGHLEREF